MSSLSGHPSRHNSPNRTDDRQALASPTNRPSLSPSSSLSSLRNTNDERPSPGGGEANDFDNSFRLPPIDPNHNYNFDDVNDDFNLPSIDDSLFDVPPQSPPPRGSPSQQASRILPRISDYILRPESPDPFSDFLASPSPLLNTCQTAPAVIDLTDSPPDMAPSKKRKADVGEYSKREPTRKSARTATPRENRSSVEMVDLEDVEGKTDYEAFQAKQQAEAIRQQNEDDASKPVKLAEFQCIICMDNPTDLTVTHCGHLFCSECLHSALHAGDKKSCPVCRTTINLGRPGAKAPKNGFFALEMKFVTANKKGKQPAKH